MSRTDERDYKLLWSPNKGRKSTQNRCCNLSETPDWNLLSGDEGKNGQKSDEKGEESTSSELIPDPSLFFTSSSSLYYDHSILTSKYFRLYISQNSSSNPVRFFPSSLQNLEDCCGSKECH